MEQKILVNGKKYDMGELLVNTSTYTPVSETNWTFVTDTLASAVEDTSKEEACLERMMEKTNPKTKELYTKEEAKRICSGLAKKGVVNSSIEPITIDQEATLVSSIECTDNGARMYHFMVADDKTLARGTEGLYQYTAESHENTETLDQWIGTPVSYANKGADAHNMVQPIGTVYDAWTDQEGLHQVVRIVESSLFKIESPDLKVSIGTIPLELDNRNVKRYEPNHLAMFHTETPGCDNSRCNIRGVVSSTGDEKMTEENPTPPQAVDEKTLRSTIEAEVKEQLQKEYDLKLLVSSVATETGIEEETITKIAGGGLEGVEAFKSAIGKMKEEAKETIVSTVGEAQTPEEKPYEPKNYSINKKE